MLLLVPIISWKCTREYAEHGVMWKCPIALETVKSEQQRRQERKALQVRIADRAKRERIFEVPGRSQSTSRAIPGAEMWGAFTDGSQTWEKFWTCPYDPDRKVVIQVGPLPACSFTLATPLSTSTSVHVFTALSSTLSSAVACIGWFRVPEALGVHPAVVVCQRCLGSTYPVMGAPYSGGNHLGA